MQSPKEYERELTRKKQEQIQILKSEKDHKVRVQENKLLPNKLDKQRRVFLMISVVMILVPVFLLLFLLRNNSVNEIEYPFFIAFFATLILVFPIAIASRKKINKKINKQILDIEEEYAKKIRKLDTQENEELKKYIVLYKNKVNEKSVSFANSELAKEIIELLSTEFAKNINALRRTSNIQFITYTYSFKVYYNKITSGYALRYDFDEHRCRNLEDIAEQEALAKILATQVQLNTMMDYSEDPTGTPTKLNIDYVYSNDNSVEVRMEYSAVNGNYEQVRNW